LLDLEHTIKKSSHDLETNELWLSKICPKQIIHFIKKMLNLNPLTVPLKNKIQELANIGYHHPSIYNMLPSTPLNSYSIF
jgi:hypothetical protein